MEQTDVVEVPFWERGNIRARDLAMLQMELSALEAQARGHAGSEIPLQSAGVITSCLKLVELSEVGSKVYALGNYDYLQGNWVLLNARNRPFPYPVARWWDLP